MDDDTTEQSRARLLAQQTALARFGELALHSDDLEEILHDACRLVAEGLGTDLAKVLERQDGNILVVRAGVGWKPGVVGEVTLKGNEGSSEGHALATGDAVVCNDVGCEDRFAIPAFVLEHDVRSLVNVVVQGVDGRPPYGVLEVDSREQRQFSEDDVSFLRTYANMLSAAVERLRADEEVRNRATDNERLLRELQHRVKNNLQVIVGLVQLQLRRASQSETREALRAVSQRVDALRLLHDKLYVSGEVDRVDLGAYLAEVAGTLLRFHEEDRTRVRLVLEIKDVTVSPEQAAPLGLMVNEFITNSLKYAFDGNPADGGIQGTIGLRLEPGRGGAARITLWDDGKGLPLERSGGTGMRMIDGLARQLATRTEWSTGIGRGARLSVLVRPAKREPS
ncbi:histidine kinase dimerization/phosphoacceptor domain -containing protein [Paeniroseomonas aquatica]|uniref:histidine kinase n=1 Tax=Paeniroseomonas aquatica TaxID=373043 RepID=A0ABT8ACR7_9PROT|nr:histidine kinase dimerization/phosphoacceptor domain -containing protein [Paeniroseomonas aquatica]MDN3567256.1 histidine kinase dimerization/phosphoacceptor domain -containing protein [Paeniroseomonas aquatica]